MQIEPDKWVEKARAQYPAGDLSRRLTKIAADSNTPGSVLETVAREALQNFDVSYNRAVDACFSVLEAVAAHPNTPPAILTELIQRSPIFCRAFCRNPVAPFILLEQPFFLSDLSEVSQLALLREGDVPALFVQMLAAEGGTAQTNAVRNAARLHVRSKSAKIGQNWQEALENYWRTECAETRNPTVRHWHADLVELGLAPAWASGKNGRAEPVHPPRFASLPVVDEWLRFKHAEGSAQRTAMMKRLAPKAEDREALAWSLRQNATPGDLRDALNGQGSPPNWITETVLRHPSVSGDLIAEIMEDCAAEARFVAGLPQTPTAILTDLLRSIDPYVRRLARRHPNAPRDAREIGRQVIFDFTSQMVEMPSPFVSFVAALNRGQRRGDSAKKVEHALWTQRLEAALAAPNSGALLPGDPAQRTGCDLLQHLSGDGNVFVRAVARAKLSDPDDAFVWINNGNKTKRYSVAG